MTTTNFILAASKGNISGPSLPTLNIEIEADDIGNATGIAKEMVSAISKAGYKTFVLYEIREEGSVMVVSFTVEHPEPIVNVRIRY